MIENDDFGKSGGDAVQSSARFGVTRCQPFATVAFAPAIACSGRRLMEQGRDFPFESRLAVTLVQQHTPHFVHFFLDFIFH
jgi:hypothetical protein